MKNRLVLLVLVLLLIVAMAIPSCTTETPASTLATKTTTTASATATTAKTTTSGNTAVQRKIVLAMESEPTSMDPNKCAGSPYDYSVGENIYDPVFACNEYGRPDPNIGVATWKVLEGGKVYELTLRKGVKFHNGDPLTTADIVFSHERSMANVANYPSYVANLDKLEVIDDYTMRFIFTKPEIIFPAQHNLYVGSKTYFDRVGEDEFMKHPVGTGPYKFVEWKAGEYLDLKVNEDYWGGIPVVKEARIVFAKEDTTRVAMLEAGEADIIQASPFTDVRRLEAAGYQSVRLDVPGTNVVQFDLINQNTPWYDVNVRKAIAYAIDREAIVNNLFSGVPKINAWLAPTDLGYDPELKPIPYDQAMAKQLLDKAGYGDGFDMPIYFMAIGEGKIIADAISGFLKAVNINCQLNALEGPAFLAQMRQWHTDPTAMVATLPNVTISNCPEPVSGLQVAFYSKHPMSINPVPGVDEIYEQAMVTVDDSARAELIKQAYRIINDYLPVVPLYSSVTVYSMASDINFKATISRQRHMTLIKNISFK